MRIHIKHGPLLINVCSFLLILIIWLLPDIAVLRIILGVPFLLYFPGYAFIYALFPGKDDLGEFERPAFSLGATIAIVPLIGVIANYAWEIDVWPILVSMALFTGIMSFIGLYRTRTEQGEKSGDVISKLKPASDWFRQTNKFNKLLLILVILTTIGAIATFAYTIITPKAGEEYTEFYLLGLEQTFDLYPREFVIGENGNIIMVRYLDAVRDKDLFVYRVNKVVEIAENSAKITAGIANHSNETKDYKVKTYLNDEPLQETDLIRLAPEQQHQELISYAIHDISGVTTTTEELNPDSTLSKTKTKAVKVKSTERFLPGDYVQIGKEVDQVKSINGDTLTLEEGLIERQFLNTQVLEIYKLEFRLLKQYQLYESSTNNTSLSLWLGKGDMSICIVNEGKHEANYQIKLKLKRVDTDMTQSVELGPGDKWVQDFDCSALWSTPEEVSFSLYRDEILIHEEKKPNDYHTLSLWMDVVKGIGDASES